MMIPVIPWIWWTQDLSESESYNNGDSSFSAHTLTARESSNPQAIARQSACYHGGDLRRRSIQKPTSSVARSHRRSSWCLLSGYKDSLDPSVQPVSSIRVKLPRGDDIRSFLPKRTRCEVEARVPQDQRRRKRRSRLGLRRHSKLAGELTNLTITRQYRFPPLEFRILVANSPLISSPFYIYTKN